MKKSFAFFLIFAIFLVCFSSPGIFPAAYADAGNVQIDISGHSNGFDDADTIINNSSLCVKTYTSNDGALIISADAKVMGSKTINAVITFKDNTVGIAFPGIDQHYYCIETEKLLELFSASGAFPAANSGASDGVSISLPMEEMQKVFMRYLGIISSIANDNNVKTSNTVYNYYTADSVQDCNVITFMPSKEDWNLMLTNLLLTVKSDSELKSIIDNILSGQYNSSPYIKEYYTLEEYIGSTMEELYKAINSALEQTDTIASALSLAKVSIASAEGRIYAIIVEYSIYTAGYESYGETSDIRTDCVFFDDGETRGLIAENKLSVNGDGISGKLESPLVDSRISYAFGFDAGFYINADITGTVFSMTGGMENDGYFLTINYSADGGNAEVNICVADSAEELNLPTEETVIVSNENEINEAFSSIYESFGKAGLF